MSFAKDGKESENESKCWLTIVGYLGYPKIFQIDILGGGGQNVDERMNIFSKVIWSDAILEKRFGRYLCTYRYIGTLIPEQSAFFSFFFFLSTRSA